MPPTATIRWSWFDLPAGLIFMMVSSLALHLALNPAALESSNLQVTIFLAAAAHICGYIAYRRFDAFPGIAATGALIPMFLLSYGVAFAFVLLLRLDYSRVQLVLSFSASTSWYLLIAEFRRRLITYRLAIIPCGDTSHLATIPNISWVTIDDPNALPHSINGIVADLRTTMPEHWERFIADCALSGTPVYHVKQVLESMTGRVRIDHLSENTLGSITPNHFYISIKRVIDWIIAVIVAIPLLPLIALAAIAIRIESSGPAIFQQKRMGYRGLEFTVYKLRTMKTSSAACTRSDVQRAMTQDDDARVTRLGRFLRRTRIDELPQILNILRGEMSWIGPRPEALPLATWYGKELPFYGYRHIVRPGITGWAQVNQGHVTQLDEVLEKLHFDFYYIKNLSLWLDILIVYRTIRTILGGFGAR